MLSFTITKAFQHELSKVFSERMIANVLSIDVGQTPGKSYMQSTIYTYLFREDRNETNVNDVDDAAFQNAFWSIYIRTWLLQSLFSIYCNIKYPNFDPYLKTCPKTIRLSAFFEQFE